MAMSRRSSGLPDQARREQGACVAAVLEKHIGALRAELEQFLDPGQAAPRYLRTERWPEAV